MQFMNVINFVLVLLNSIYKHLGFENELPIHDAPFEFKLHCAYCTYVLEPTTT
jgi:hypothetical protein